MLRRATASVNSFRNANSSAAATTESSRLDSVSDLQERLSKCGAAQGPDVTSYARAPR
jgi:hypothetical protein